MNNSKMIKDSQGSTPEENHMTQIALSNAESILEAVKGLKDNNDYYTFKRLILDPSIDAVQKRMERNLKDLMEKPQVEREILRDQGMLVAFKKFADLDEMEKVFSMEVEKITKILRK